MSSLEGAEPRPHVMNLDVAAPFPRGRRGWMVRRALALSDVTCLTLAFLITSVVFAPNSTDAIAPRVEWAFFLLTLPVWVVLAQLLGLYAHDEELADPSTADEVTGVIHLVTLGTWVLFVASWASGVVEPQIGRLVCLWVLAVALVPLGRVVARSACRRSDAYIQRAVVVGAGHVGQLVARKLHHHPEYGIQLVGFVDERPREQRVDIGQVPVLGGVDELDEIVADNSVDRVIVAFSGEPDAKTMALVRALRDREVVVDIVPRLFEVLGPRAHVHTMEGLSLITLPPMRLSRSSQAVKRFTDIVLASILLILAAPMFAFVALRVKLDSRGPVFFRQTRLGVDMKPFTTLKFRTMRVGTEDESHRVYIRATMDAGAVANIKGMYKLDRDEAVTPFGSWLRRTSLDELPQLINVLRGEMSLVGPRPCIPYETENFGSHHFERFLVLPGVTGLWQVTARARSTFGEALDMDVAYVRGWSLGLDFRLLFRTPFALLRQRKATA
jgi:exopolysaccharide biosynthesis polyprenyl glycosylphosphotransferase